MAERGAEHERKGDRSCQSVGWHLVEEELQQPRVRSFVSRAGVNCYAAALDRFDGRRGCGVTPAEEMRSDVNQVKHDVRLGPGEPFGDKESGFERSRLRLGVAADNSDFHLHEVTR